MYVSKKALVVHNLLRNKVGFAFSCHFRPVYPLEAVRRSQLSFLQLVYSPVIALVLLGSKSLRARR